MGVFIEVGVEIGGAVKGPGGLIAFRIRIVDLSVLVRAFDPV